MSEKKETTKSRSRPSNPGAGKSNKPTARTIKKRTSKSETVLSRNKNENLLHERAKKLNGNHIKPGKQNKEWRTVRQLELSLKKYTDLYEFAPSGYFTLDRNGTITEVNFTGARFLGYEKSEILSKPLLQFIPPGDAPVFESHKRRVLETEIRQACVIHLRRKDGSLLDVHIESVFDKEGLPRRAALIRTAVANVSECKRAEYSLRQREELLASMFESAGVGIAEADPATGRLLRVNQAWLKLTGYAETDIRNKTFSELTHPDDRQADWEGFSHMVRGDVETYEAEKRLLRKDGSVIWCIVTVNLIRDSEGKPLRTVAVVNDITERKRTETELLRTSQEMEHRVRERTAALARMHEVVSAERQRLYEVLDTLPVYVVLITKDYRVPFANRFFRERFGDAGTRPCHQYLFGLTEPCENCESFQVFSTNAPHHWEWTGPDKRIYSIYDFPFTDVEGSSLILEVGIDITDHKHAETALRQWNESLEQRVTERTMALHESKKRMQEVLGSIAEAFIALDSEWRFLEINPVAERELFNRPASELLGNVFWDLYPKARGGVFQQHYENAFREQTPVHFEALSNVTDKWLEVHAYPRKNRLDIYFRDISDRKRFDENIWRHNKVLNGISRILKAALSSRTEEDLGRICLEVAEQVTGSKFGFINELDPDGPLYQLAVSDPGWTLCSVSGKAGHGMPPRKFQIEGLYGRVITEGVPVLTNDPKTHPDSRGIPDGHPVITAFLGVPLKHEGKTIGLIAVANREGGYTADDTESLISLAGPIVQAFMHRRSEKALRQSEEKYRQLFQSMSEGFLLLEMIYDNSGAAVSFRYLDANPALERLTHLKTSDIIGKDVRDVLPELEQYWIETFGQVAKTNVPAHMEYYSKPLNGWFEAYAYSPEPNRVAITYKNVTERKRAEKALQVSEILAQDRLLELQAIYDTAPVGLCVLDLELRFLRVNKAMAEMNGVPVEEHIGRTVSEVLPDIAQGAEDAVQRILNTGEPLLNIEIHGETPARPGIRRTWLEHWFPLRNSDDRIIGLNIVAEEITERKHAEEEINRLNMSLSRNVQELKASNRDLEAFVYSVTHDLRAPLRSIRGFSEALLEDTLPVLGDQGKNHLDRIINNAMKMDELINNLLHLSRLSKQHISRTTLDMTGMVQGQIDELRQREPHRVVTLSVQDGLTILADPGLLKLALANLLENAWKFTSRTPDARIEFGALTDRNGTVYYVRDNGAGFDPELVKDLFTPFRRLHNAGEFEGTGIGLAIVERVIRRHSGRIWAEGKPGQGACFYFTLQ